MRRRPPGRRNNTLLLLFTNVGSFGPINSEFRKNVYLTHNKIKDDFNKYPDISSFSEAGDHEVELAPVFGGPTGNNKECQIMQNGANIRRGILTFSDPNTTCLVPNLDNNFEIVTTIHKFTEFQSCTSTNRNRGTKTTDIAAISVYRNQTAVTAEDLRIYIQDIIKNLNGKYGVRKYVVFGDFNDENFNLSIDGFREIAHDDMKHKMDSTSRATAIDKVFSNVENIRIAAVYPSCENKTQNEEHTIGHKSIVIEIGDKPEPVEAKIFLNKKHQTVCSGINGVTPVTWQEMVIGGKEIIDQACGIIGDMITDSVEGCYITTQKTSNRNNKKAAALIKKCEGKKPSDYPINELYRAAAEFKSGVDKEDPIEPPPEKLKEKLQEKLHNLNQGDHAKIQEAVNEIWGERYKHEKVIASFPDKQEAKKIVMSTSNSGAIDVHGLSLKHTKTFLKYSSFGWDFYWHLTKAMAITGYVPSNWRIDVITFLYKRKGLRSDPGNWRPITIAPSLGKHNEKLMLWQLRKIDDCNEENHAYCPNKSCVTAMLGVSEHMKTLRERREELRKIGKKLIVIFEAEDISSAFESIEHAAIWMFSEATIDELNSEVKLKEQFKSYLSRQSFVTKRGTDLKIEVEKKYEDRTSPQGSILSPAFWRIFDKIFSHMYKKSMDEYTKNDAFIDSYKHISYAVVKGRKWTHSIYL